MYISREKSYTAPIIRCLITVGVGLVGSVDRDANVIGLFLRKLGELGTKMIKMKKGDLLVEGLREDVNLS